MGHPVHSGELSQPFDGASARPSEATSTAAAPYAARTRGYYRQLSASSVGIELAVAVLLGVFFGRWLDGKLGTTPWMMLVFLGLGFTAGMRSILRFVRRDAAAADASDAATDARPGESKA